MENIWWRVIKSIIYISVCIYYFLYILFEIIKVNKYFILLFSTGGDEFVMVIKTGYGTAALCKLYNFYTRFKSEINGLGKEYNIKSAEDRKGNKIDLSFVGISCGIYIPYNQKNTESDWLDIADKKALETAKTTNGIKKKWLLYLLWRDS